jgi:voltage-gated potassium channel
MSAPSAEALRPELGNPGYELFIVGLSIVSLVNLVISLVPADANVESIALIMDLPISAILLFDFTRRLVRSHPRRAYFIADGGWLDLLGSLPFSKLRIFRLFRVVRVVRLLHAKGGRAILRSVMRHRADNALLIILFLVIVLLEFGSMSVLVAERSSPDANIKTGGEALWWAFVSITTVGYGDFYPTSTWGRTFAIFILAAGVGMFGALSGFLANFFLSPAKEDVETSAAGTPPDPIRRLDELEAHIASELAAIRGALVTTAQAPVHEVPPEAGDTTTDAES